MKEGVSAGKVMPMSAFYRACAVLGSLTVLLVGGCREGGPSRSGYVIAPSEQKIRVAVMPFDAASQRQDDSGQIVAQELVTALVGSEIFEVVEPGAVYAALVELGVRNGYGLSPQTMVKLQDRVGPVDIFVVGLVQDYSEVRVGPASYPTISLNARVIDGYTGSILWSGSVSRTGSDSEKFFGIGAVHSRGRLARAAVRDLIGTLDQRRLMSLIALASLAGEEREQPRSPAARTGTTKTVVWSGNEGFLDESVVISEADMRSALVDVEGLVKGSVLARQHHFSIVETTYDGTGTEIKAKLVDYRKVDAAKGYVRLEHPGETEQELNGLPVFMGSSAQEHPGAHYVDVAAGRFGIYVMGPNDRASTVQTVASSIVEALR